MASNNVRKDYRCAWQIHHHIVFPVKYIKAFIDEDLTNIIKETASGIAERYAIEIEALDCDKDHIHLLCGAHLKIALGRIIQIFKSITAREIFRRKPSVKKVLWGGEFWTDGYYVTMLQQLANAPTGIRSKNMFKNKVNQNQMDNCQTSAYRLPAVNGKLFQLIVYPRSEFFFT